MTFDPYKDQLPDPFGEETGEWLEALDDVIDVSGKARARFLLHRVLSHARRQGIGLPAMVQSDYINSIHPEHEPYYPGNEEIEHRIRRIIRWNAAVMVLGANELFPGIGGHLATYASAAGLYEVGFNHFFRGKDHPGGGDQVFIQGHATPGVYARAYLEGRLTESQIQNFRREVFTDGVSSYPHPRLMPEFWEFPTVSMGLGPINAIYQARFNRYLQNRGLKDTSEQRVWCFPGDGEMDEPESIGALHLATRERLDNLIFVVNCNLQRLDGPVRGNGKIIQELESEFRGAGWHVIKVVWGREWDELLAKDTEGVLVHKMNTTLDGEFQRYAVETGEYIREHFFGPDPRLREMVDHLSDDDLWRLRRGGHDNRKVFAAYQLATELKDAPVVILAKTVKGWALPWIAGKMSAHQMKAATEDELRKFAESLHLEISEKKLKGEEPPFFHPGADTDEVAYLLDKRKELGGFIPERRVEPEPIELPNPKVYEGFDAGTTEKQEVSTTTAFVRLLRDLLRDEKFGPHVVPVIPDEARTFGVESLFKDFKIYAPLGQLYEPADARMLISYLEATDGQILEEGITEAGSMASTTAAGTAYATHGKHMVPFFMFYSMFGFQRIGDLIWSFADSRGRGFLLGCTAGRTTLNGEGLQHEDGHSQLLASVVPNCHAYDPAFAFETAAIVKDGLRRMLSDGEDIFYYLTLYNENYQQLPRPKGKKVTEGILRGLYLLKPGPKGPRVKAQLFGSGSILATEVMRAQELLADRFDVSADVWSATSYKALREDALEVERWNRLNPDSDPKASYLEKSLEGVSGPVIAASDWMKAVPDQISRWVPSGFHVLGTDGFGRSDTRKNLRRFFEVDAEHIVVAALSALAEAGDVKRKLVGDAIKSFELENDRLDPTI